MADEDSGRIEFEDEELRQGYTVLKNGYWRAIKTSPGAKLLYFCLLSYAWQDGACFPGQARLAEDCGTTERTVRRWLIELESSGYIEVRQRGLNLTNLYVIKRLSPLST